MENVLPTVLLIAYKLIIIAYCVMLLVKDALEVHIPVLNALMDIISI